MDVVILVVLARIHTAAALRKDADQPGRGLQIRFLRIRPDGGERVEPFLARLACIEGALLGFGGQANLALLFG